MKNISIYSVYHKASHIVENTYVKPIQVGSGEDIPHIKLRDNTGDNISNKNGTFCELTAQYWAWKNDLNSDYIGIMHYRRFFDFNSKEQRELNTYGILEEPEFNLDFLKKFGVSEDDIEEQVLNYDLVLPIEWNVTSAGWKNIKHNYINSIYHHERDLDATRDIIKRLYPDYITYFDEAMNSTTGYFTNMFILKRELFNDYSQWLFNILFELENIIDISSYDVQERRVFGYLSERLFNVWLLKLFTEKKSIKVNFLRRVFVQNTDAKNWIAKTLKTDKKIVSIVIASDDNYSSHLGALIQSILDNFSQDRFLDIIILDGGISNYNKFLLNGLLGENSHIQFLDLSSEFSNQSTHMHFSKATFYRLILDKLILDRDKVLYIDCDTIVLDDVSKLFDTDLGNNAIGAVYDYIMHHFCQMGIPSIDFTGGVKSKDYLQNYVGIKEWDKYFQAGVILFNLDKMRKMDLSEVMIKSLLDKRYWFLDQDILNKYLLGKVTYLDPSWNVVNCGHEIYEGLSNKQILELKRSEANPKIIHYAGYETKPWNNRNAKFSEYYFYYLRKTFWYEKVMFKFPTSGNQENNQPMIINIPEQHRSLVWRVSRKIWLKLPFYLRRRLGKLKEFLKTRL
ncbi:hypothetical protein F544_19090 [Bibersteinia trehalosi USDA-ARS-USMARC-190]|uniref:DUF4422 domain-containing protein n=1 Tax=Bibersteinia trehalosi USDA-ARS-USMARC-190 TaxID=1263832 RepID=W0R9L3_BIBTR|nr:DUF4422 domain-containing protein [Bibersteinia trehalosi]AHG87137.1 hypothetical protein F544_19090 [Bibersteinia trehalosi USDA-ARS-USMARC-190]